MDENDRATCKTLLSLLSDYVDGELSEDLCQLIEQHVSDCQNCRVVVDTMRKTIFLYHDSATEAAEISGSAREKLFRALNLEDYLQH